MPIEEETVKQTLGPGNERQVPIKDDRRKLTKMPGKEVQKSVEINVKNMGRHRKAEGQF